MSNHTPGPWVWAEEAKDRGSNRGMQLKTRLISGNSKRRIVMSPNWSEFDGEVWQAWSNISEADACLIAAAPELLEGLRICVNFGLAVADTTDDKYLKEAILNDVAKAQAAIAEAEGVTL